MFNGPANSSGRHYNNRRYYQHQKAIKTLRDIKSDCFYWNKTKHRLSQLKVGRTELLHLLLARLPQITFSDIPCMDSAEGGYIILKGNKANDTFPTLSAVNLPAGNPLPGIRYGPVKAEVKSISSHRRHRKLQMTCYRRVEKT